MSRIATSPARIAAMATVALPLTLVAQPTGTVQTERVTWSVAAHPTRDAVQLTATIARGWHVYALTQRDEGPIPLRISLVGDSTLRSGGDVRGPVPQRIPTSPFGIPVVWYTNTARFTVPVQRVDTAHVSPIATIAVRFQACSDSLCLPPKTIQLTQALTRRPASPLRGRTNARTTI